MSVLNYKIQKSFDREKFWTAREFFLEPGVLKASDHGFRCGSTDDYYFDIDYALNDPYKCEFILGIYADHITKIKRKTTIDLLAFLDKSSGGTVGAIRLAAALSIKTNLPNVIVRPWKSITFEQVKVPFAEQEELGIKAGLRGLRAIIVTDHCTTGREALLATNILRKNNAIVQYIVAYTIRLDKLKSDEYKEANIDLCYAYGLPPHEKLPRNHAQLDAIAVNF